MISNWFKFLESVGNVPISNMHSYIEGMVLSYADKLFFLDKIDADIIVDFGCADGAILEKISRANPNIKLIGYDLDEKMLSIAKSKLGRKAILTSDWKKVEKIISKYNNPALILSSVIHEVYSYSHSFIIKKFWDSQVFGDKFKWICIRDMIPMADMHKTDKNKFIRDVMRVRNRSNKEILASFENHWGKLSNNYRTFIHYLLKYKYVDNWDREVKENYVPITLETLYKKIPSNYKIVYQDNFILPILQQQVKKDFNIEIKHTTHTKLIIENKNFR
jgi:ribosomal protein L11 methylase PrmA